MHVDTTIISIILLANLVMSVAVSNELERFKKSQSRNVSVLLRINLLTFAITLIACLVLFANNA
jgi:hypothetical protein